MKPKILLLGTCLAAVAGLLWLGQTYRNARNNLVTLKVRDMPIADILALLQRQTRETIVADQNLDARITLTVKRTPLADVLHLLSQQAGASWTEYHAVHGSDPALEKLIAALRNRSSLEAAGWTNIAPVFDPPPGGEGTVMKLGEGVSSGGLVQRRVVTDNSGPVIIRRETAGEGGVSVDVETGPAPGAGPGQLPPDAETADVDVRVDGPAPGHPGGRAIPERRMIRMVTMARDASGKMTQEVWSPEVISLETRLSSKLGADKPQDASVETAQEVAAKLGAKTRTIYALRKMPGGFSMPPELMGGQGGHTAVRRMVTAGGTNTPVGEMPDVESMVRRAQAENFTKLTPEQRVRRAQERQAAGTNR